MESNWKAMYFGSFVSLLFMSAIFLVSFFQRWNHLSNISHKIFKFFWRDFKLLQIFEEKMKKIHIKYKSCSKNDSFSK